ncbi:hypothetical protein J3A64_002738 [Pseudarthrobacter sp. PvP004]|uniref:Uncharacterized protein n=1 Tax=Paenarthrobacter aurescens (strain TC1) TaxID=290340 RepID=A1R3B9_PAEAT|nr:hypothetical protein AAur_0941 [Paenarthrobacter aurescens TC1]MBP2267274.1 hypothetical protein [Pseudarthrobacter sp. PvP004]
MPWIFLIGLGFTAMLVGLLMRMYVKANAAASKVNQAG